MQDICLENYAAGKVSRDLCTGKCGERLAHREVVVYNLYARLICI